MYDKGIIKNKLCVVVCVYVYVCNMLCNDVGIVERNIFLLGSSFHRNASNMVPTLLGRSGIVRTFGNSHSFRQSS